MGKGTRKNFELYKFELKNFDCTILKKVRYSVSKGFEYNDNCIWRVLPNPGY
jgi:hypothetical protein